MEIVRFDRVLDNGLHNICKENVSSSMLMDIDVLKLKKGDNYKLYEEKKEMAILVIGGHVTLKWERESAEVLRNSCFDEKPSALHVSKGIEVVIEAMNTTVLLLQRTSNSKTFASKLYTPADCVENIFGEDLMNNTARRLVRDIFNYNNASYSNMVMGEVLTMPGSWSSYPPHSHAQPEVYYYRFTQKAGFGCSIIGDNAYKITHNSASLIKGDLVHPQVSAPGYGMYYCWMIRHLENNPWTERIDEEEHTWLYDKNASIWQGI